MRSILPALLVTCLVVVQGSVFAGDLIPPAGPIVSTMKTLQQIEPRIPINSTNTPGDADSTYKISRPGNYYLTDNLIGEFGKAGIEIEAANVTVDLMGFELVGVFGSLDGIAGTSAPDGVTIRNGRVSKWGDDGIDLHTTANVVLESIVVSGAAGWGLDVGFNASIRDCTTSGCTIGIFVSGQANVSGCASYQNVADGFLIGWGSLVSDCISRDNGNDGYEIGNGVNVVDCASMSNGATGFNAGEGCSISRCTSYQDVFYGVHADEGTTVADCTVRFARPAGIFLQDYAVARDNTVSQTINDGIVAASYCTVIGNSVLEAGVSNDNFGVGIRVTGNDTRIEANQCTRCDLGMRVTATENLIIRNTCSANSAHWDIAAGNRLAPIVLGGLNAAPVMGSTYAGSLGTTDPNANFTY